MAFWLAIVGFGVSCMTAGALMAWGRPPWAENYGVGALMIVTLVVIFLERRRRSKPKL